MDATIVCANCGAEGESNFSTNYFGELVCELCGTQSYLQTRTETQDAEDMGIDFSALSRMKQRTKRKKRERKVKVVEQKAPVQLFDCIVATQYILNEQAEALVAVGFPPELPRVVKEIWFHLLHVWQSKGVRPLLRCFTEFYYPRQAADKAMDPAVTNDVLEKWDAENDSNIGRIFTQSQSSIRENDVDAGPTTAPRETAILTANKLQHILDWFVLPDLIGILVLAGRMLNVPAVPCDYAYWIDRGDLPYYNVLSLCPVAIQEAVEQVSVFFDATIRTNWVSTAVIAYRAHYLQFHLEMLLPPLNASLIAYNMCENLNFPPQVFRNFQWISANFNLAGDLPEKRMEPTKLPRNEDNRNSALDSAAGIAAYLLAAIRLCPNWNEWIYERVLRREQHVPPYSVAEADRLPRRELGDFVEFCEKILLASDRGRIPEEFESHIEHLKKLGEYEDRDSAHSYSDHSLRSYPPVYAEGVCVEQTEDIQERVDRVKARHNVSVGGADEKVPFDEELDRPVPPTYFYPLYSRNDRTCFHPPFEAALELLAEYIDCPMGLVMRWVDRIDGVMRERTREATRAEAVERSEEEKKLKEMRKAEEESRREVKVKDAVKQNKTEDESKDEHSQQQESVEEPREEGAEQASVVKTRRPRGRPPRSHVRK